MSDISARLDDLSTALRDVSQTDKGGDWVVQKVQELKQETNPIKRISLLLFLYREAIHPMLVRREIAKLDTIRSMIEDQSNG